MSFFKVHRVTDKDIVFTVKFHKSTNIMCILKLFNITQDPSRLHTAIVTNTLMTNLGRQKS